MKKWIIKYYFLLIVVIIAFILRLFALLHYGQFWDDEMFSFIFSQKSWSESLHFWLWETNPPLHLFLLKFWFCFAPTTEFWARMPSLIAGVASIPIIYQLGKKWFNHGIGLISALFLALHPYHIFWSATARVYVFLMLLALLSVYFFYGLIYENKKGVKFFIFTAFTNVLLLFSHLSAIFIIGAQLLILIANKRNKFKLWLQINYFPFLLSGAWIASSLFLKKNNQLGKAWFFNLEQDWHTTLSPLVNLTVGLYPLPQALFIIITVLILLTVVIYQQIKQKNEKTFSLTLLALFPIIASFFMGAWHIKFFLISLPFLIILIVVGLVSLLKNKLTAILIITLLCFSGWLYLLDALPLTNWQPVQQYLLSRYRPEQKPILLYNNLILKPQIEKYLALPFPTQGFDLGQKNMSWEEWAVKKNYLYLIYTAEEIAGWRQEKNLEQEQRIFLIQGEYGYMTPLREVLKKNGFALQSPPWRLPILGRYYLYDYHKNASSTLSK